MSKNNEISSIILGAGEPYKGVVPSGLRTVEKQKNVLDWQLHSIQKHCSEVQFIAGFNYQRIFNFYPNLNFVLNSDWESTASVVSLSKALFRPSKSYLVSYGDIIFWDDLLDEMIKHDDAVVVAVDRFWDEGSYLYRRADFESIPTNIFNNRESVSKRGDSFGFTGMVYVPMSVQKMFLMALNKEIKSTANSHLSCLIQRASEMGIPIKAFDATGKWCDLNQPVDLARFIMGTKAETLERLRARVKKSSIPDQVRFKHSEYFEKSDAVIEKILKKFANKKLAVRSSAKSEDGFSASKAGLYESELNVLSKAEGLRGAIDRVLASYEDDNAENQVFVQPMVENVIASGVVFTRLPHNSSPYYRINYASGDDTSSVTSGASKNDDCIVLMKSESMILPKSAPGWCKSLVTSAKEVEEILGIDYLDIEFAIDKSGDVHILQARPLVLDDQPSHLFDEHVFKRAIAARDKFKKHGESNPGVPNAPIVFGIMPDWNPAEIIGTFPSVLSSSLYNYLIMDSTWAKQRSEFGYKDLEGTPLMHLFSGQPYVDVRASLASFVPASVSEQLSQELVNFSVEKLRANRELHDKIEFEIIPTCHDLNFDVWERQFLDHGFLINEVSEIESSLKEITELAFRRINEDFRNIEFTQKRLEEIERYNFSDTLSKVHFLLHECKRIGTLNFAHMARHGFVAISLLKSLSVKGILKPDRVDEFLASLSTVATSLQRDAWLCKNGKINLRDFIRKYGHLRPGTYDATSKRYDEDIDFYIQPIIENATKLKNENFDFTKQEKVELEKAFLDSGFDIDGDEFQHYCKQAIEGREYSKFVFTQYLSEAIKSLTIYGSSIGLSVEEVSSIPLSEWREFYQGIVSTRDEEKYFKDRASLFVREMFYNKGVELPALLFEEEDFFGFKVQSNTPNFVTKKTVSAELVEVELGGSEVADLRGKIALIEAADPGYDWLFSHDIKALITCYGGANSHMAIRASEFGLPAAIGVGQSRYQELKIAKKISLDCKIKKITVIQ